MTVYRHHTHKKDTEGDTGRGGQMNYNNTGEVSTGSAGHKTYNNGVFMMSPGVQRAVGRQRL